MAYDYDSNALEIRNSKNYFLNSKSVILNEGSENPERKTVKTIIDSNFDLEKGFSSSGDFCMSVINSRNNKEISKIKSKNFKLEGVLYSFDSKSRKINMAYDSENKLNKINDMVQTWEKNETNFREIRSNNYSDLQFLYDEYLFKYFQEKFGTNNYLETEEFIRENKLQNELSSYIIDLVDIYNNSYLLHKNEIEESSNISGYDQFHDRYNKCTMDNQFKKKIENRQILFENAVNSNKITISNIRGDKSKSFLDNLDSYQKQLDNISSEVLFRCSMNAVGAHGSDTGVMGKIRKAGKKLSEDIQRDGLISLSEKKELKRLENEIYKGTISANDRAKYDDIVKGINDKYNNYLRSFETQAKNLENYYLGENARKISLIKGKEDPKNPPIFNLLGVIQHAREDLTQFKIKQLDTLDAQIILKQNEQLEKEINKHSEITETGEILLDKEKRAVIDKIRTLSNLSTEDIKESQIKTLLGNDIPALKNIVYKTESFCGLKDFYLNDIQEKQRQELFGEHYHYLSADKFFDKILEKTEELNNESLIEISSDDLSRYLDRWLNIMKATSNLEISNQFKEIKNFLEKVNPKDLNDYLPITADENENNKRINYLIDKVIDKNKADKSLKDENFKEFFKDTLKRATDESQIVDKNKVNNAELKAFNNRLIENLNDSLMYQVSNISSLKRDIKNILASNEKSEIDLFTNDKLDIRKILLLRKSLYEEFNNAPSITSEQEILKSEIAKKIVFLEEKILNYKVNRNKNTLAVSPKDRLAYSALNLNEKLISDFNSEDKIKNKEEIKNLEDSLHFEKLRYYKIKKTKEYKFASDIRKKFHNKRIDSLEKQINEIQEQINEKKDAYNGYNNEILKNLNKIADDLEKSLESNKDFDKEVNISIEALKPNLEDLRDTLKEINITRASNNLKDVLAKIDEDKKDTNYQDVMKAIEDNDLLVLFSNFSNLDNPNKENLIEAINKIQNNMDEVNNQFQILLGGIKENSFKEVSERISSNEFIEGKFSLKLINSEFGQFEKNEKRKLLESVNKMNTTYDSLRESNNISIGVLKNSVDYLIRNEYQMIPLNIEGSNELYKILNNNTNPYNYKIKVFNKELDISSQEVRLFKNYIKDGNLQSFDYNLDILKNEKNNLTETQLTEKLQELEAKFEEILNTINITGKEFRKGDFSAEDIKIEISLTDEGRKNLIRTINAYGDDEKVFIIPETENLNFKKRLIVSLDSSKGDNTSLDFDYNKYLKPTDNLNYLIFDKLKDFDKENISNDVLQKVEIEQIIKEYEYQESNSIDGLGSLRNAIINYSNSTQKDESLAQNIIDYLNNPSKENCINPKEFQDFLGLDNKETLKVSQNLIELLEENVKSNITEQKIRDLQQIEQNLQKDEKVTSQEEQKERKPKSIFPLKDNKIELAEIIDDMKKKIDLVTKNAAYNNGFSHEEREKIEEFEKAIKEIENSISSKKLKKQDLKENIEKSQNLNQQIEKTFEKRFKQIEENEQKEELKEQKKEKTKDKDSNDFEV